MNPPPKQIRKTVVPFVCCSLILTAGAIGHEQADTETHFTEGSSLFEVEGTDAKVAAYRRNGHVARLYGQAFSNGATPEASVQAFVDANAGRLGLAGADLVPSARHTLPLVWQADTETYKFTAVYYDQVRDGVPVFRSRLVFVVRNDAGFPLVSANPRTTRDLGDFAVLVNPFGPDLVPATVAQRFGPESQILSRKVVIFAGVEDDMREPTMAEAVVVAPDDVDRWLVVVDVATGDVLFEEHQIFFADVEGNVAGLATEGVGAEQCEDEVPFAIPYLLVSGDGQSTFTDVDGNYVLSGASGSVTVSGNLGDGAYFQVEDYPGSGAVGESTSGAVPGPVDLLFNATNVEQERAQVNGYVYSNGIRDFVVKYNPGYPNLDPGDGFPVVVNRTDGFCPGNAWYDPGAETINFCLSAGSTPNTAWSSVVYHEYGHHLVAAGGSGQGAYGEGMGDTMSSIILDDADLGVGFFGSCSSALRDADNDLQYPCDGAIHFCGQLISGCVWDTRNELVITQSDTYQDIIGSLVVNSIPMHTGSGIDPSITIDFLTLDDDNGNIFDGTPHYFEIAAGLRAHNMDAPDLALLDFSFPSGQPELVDPAGTTTLLFQVDELISELDSTSVRMLVDTGSGFASTTPDDLGGGLFEATFPTSDCGTSLAYYFKALTTDSMSVFYPADAPVESFGTLSAAALNVVASDDFESDTGWTVVNTALEDGAWERGTPAGDGDRGDPLSDSDGSGQCYLTDNVAGNSDVDGGPTQIISPVFDLSGTSDPIVEYARWFTNDDLDEDRLDVHVTNNGSTWTLVESAPHAGEAWVKRSFVVSDYVTPNDQVQIRFSATDNPNNSVTEAGIDGFKVIEVVCSDTCTGDVDGSGEVDFGDLVGVLSMWGPCSGCAEDIDGSGDVGFPDLLTILAAFGPCP